LYPDFGTTPGKRRDPAVAAGFRADHDESTDRIREGREVF
jgi:hypothetical protein